MTARKVHGHGAVGPMNLAHGRFQRVCEFHLTLGRFGVVKRRHAETWGWPALGRGGPMLPRLPHTSAPLYRIAAMNSAARCEYDASVVDRCGFVCAWPN